MGSVFRSLMADGIKDFAYRFDLPLGTRWALLHCHSSVSFPPIPSPQKLQHLRSLLARFNTLIEVFFPQHQTLAATLCDLAWKDWCILFIKLLPGPVLGVIKSSEQRAAMHISFHSISSHSPPSPHPPPTTHHCAHPPLSFCWGVCLYTWWSEDRGAITYQCSLPCFNTEQMNGLHAISLKDSAAEGAVEVESRVWVCWCVGVWVGVLCKVPWAPQPELHHTYRS